MCRELAQASVALWIQVKGGSLLLPISEDLRVSAPPGGSHINECATLMWLMLLSCNSFEQCTT